MVHSLSGRLKQAAMPVPDVTLIVNAAIPGRFVKSRNRHYSDEGNLHCPLVRRAEASNWTGPWPG